MGFVSIKFLEAQEGQLSALGMVNGQAQAAPGREQCQQRHFSSFITQSTARRGGRCLKRFVSWCVAST